MRQTVLLLGSWTWDQAERKCSGGLRPPSLFPERMPQVGLNLRPCGHGAEALLDEPPSHVRKMTDVTGQRAREGCLLLRMPEALVLGLGLHNLTFKDLHSPVLGYLFIGISVGDGTSDQLVGNPRIPTCPPDCDSPDKHYPWSCRGVVLTCMGVCLCLSTPCSDCEHMLHHCRSFRYLVPLQGCDPNPWAPRVDLFSIPHRR